MKWQSHEVARFAYGAGFRAEALTEAVALALAVSGGDDLYRWGPATSPDIDLAGLWGVQVDAERYGPAFDYADPTANAAAAYAEWERFGQSFTWSRAYNGAEYGRWMTTARAVTAPGAREPRPAGAGPVDDLQGSTDSLLDTAHRTAGGLFDAARAFRSLK